MLKTIQKLKTFSFNYFWVRYCEQGFSVLFSYRKKLPFVDKKEINEVSTLSKHITELYLFTFV